MCGIAGFMRIPGLVKSSTGGHQTARDIADAKMAHLRYSNFLPIVLKNMERMGRGSSATGLFAGKNYRKNHIERSNGNSVLELDCAAIPASRFIDTRRFQRIAASGASQDEVLYYVGHVRAATQGRANTNKNNHPFKCGNIVGVHNGGINNFREIIENNDEVVVKGNCDSESIFALLDVNCTEETSYKKAIRATAKELEGWFSCVAADATRYRQLFFFKNDAAPLVLLCDLVNGYVSFCSTMKILKKSLKEALIISDDFKEISYNGNTGLILDVDKIKSFEDMKSFSLTAPDEYSAKTF
jgi:hypothetical protein